MAVLQLRIFKIKLALDSTFNLSQNKFYSNNIIVGNKNFVRMLYKMRKQLIFSFRIMFNLQFGGNPAVMELIQAPETDIDKLLDLDSFPSQFRTCNPKLEHYMDMSKYNRLVQYITYVGDPENRNRSYKYPLAAAEILSIDNSKTMEALLKQTPTLVQTILKQQIQVQKEVDQCDSQYYSSDGSQGSNKNIQQFFQKTERENIPPKQDKAQNKVLSNSSKKNINENQSSQQRKSMGSSSVSITSDDFPFVEQETKKIKVKQIKITKQLVEVKPLLQQLCQFFQREMNHTLTGYVSKVLQLVLKKSPRRLLRDIFSTKAHKYLIKHCDSHSLCQFIINVLLCPQNEVENAREYLVGSMLKALLASSEDEQKNMQNKSILYILTQLIAKLDPQSSKWHMVLMIHIYQQQSLPKISSLVFEPKTTHKNKETYAQLILNCLKKLINPIIINAPNTISSLLKTSEEQNIKELRHKLSSKFEACFKQFIDKVWENLLQAEISNNYEPSFVYLKQLEILNMLIKNNMYWARMELSNQQKIFTTLINLCKKYPNNSFIHNQVFDLLKEIVHISREFPSIFLKTFDCKNFIVFCLQTISTTSHKPHMMYKGQCIYLCQAIRHCNSEMAMKFKKQHNQKWHKVQQAILHHVQKINSTLGGFSTKKPHKPQILFNKESIFQKFSNFLKGQVPLKKHKSIEQEELQEITSQGSAQWSDWSQFSNYSADEVDEKQNKIQSDK